jgi:hypothetical protein
LDCTLHGTDNISAGLAIRATNSLEGLVIQRCEARNFHDWGFLVDANSTTYVPTTPPLLEDIYTENCVWQTNPQGSNGVSEAGVWLGCKGTINRLWCHQVPGYATVGARGQIKAWQGLWIGTACRNSVFSDVLCTGYLGFGCYGFGKLNADGSSITAVRFETHSPVSVGWHQEWNHNVGNNTINVLVRDSYIETDCTGVHYDQGTAHSTVKNTTFVGQAYACISNYLEDGGNPNLYDLSGNDYSGKLVGAVSATTAQAGNASCWNT